MSGRNLVYGRHPVELALKGGRRVEVVYATDRAAEAMDPKLLRSAPVVRVSRRFLEVLTGGANHQGIVARTAPPRYLNESNLEELVERDLGRDETPLILFLDRVEDPRNLGAILRSAHELGAAAVVVPQRHAAGLTPAAVKVAAGAAEFVPVARVANLAKTIRNLRHFGLAAVAALGEKGALPEEVDLTRPLCLVLGAEGRGIRPGILAQCPERIAIPISGRVGSLNVSVAAGILLAEAARQRRARGKD